MKKNGAIVAAVAAVLMVFSVPAGAQQARIDGTIPDGRPVVEVAPVPSVVNPPGDLPEPNAYGTTLYSVYNGVACDAVDRGSYGTTISNCDYVKASGTYTYVGWPVHVPTGAVVEYARIYFNQTVIGDTIGASLRKTDQFGVGTTAFLMAPTATTAGDTMQQFGPFTEVINNAPSSGYTYNFIAYIPGATRIYKMMVYYKLQVSAPPATATFSDVPTTSGYFKFVEALYASGITAGCGTGLYCPDAPLTRGQMAVYLSAALGLSYQY